MQSIAVNKWVIYTISNVRQKQLEMEAVSDPGLDVFVSQFTQFALYQTSLRIQHQSKRQTTLRIAQCCHQFSAIETGQCERVFYRVKCQITFDGTWLINCQSQHLPAFRLILLIKGIQ